MTRSFAPLGPKPFLQLAVAALVVLGLVSPAFAQNSVPPALLNNNRQLQGDQIRFCVDDFSPGAPVDRAISEAVAGALLVKATFVPAPTGFPLDGTGYLDELQLVMNTDCDVMAGISIEPSSTESPYPDWATVSRPYAEIPFVLVVKDPTYQSLGDIPVGKTLGASMGSVGQNVILTYNAQQSEEKRLRYLPYADPKLMLKRLLDGSLAGMVIYQPSLLAITNNDPAAAGVRIISMSPLQPVNAAVGYLVQARDTYMRSQLDTAIGSLVADGTIAKLLQEHNYMGTAGP